MAEQRNGELVQISERVRERAEECESQKKDQCNGEIY